MRDTIRKAAAARWIAENGDAVAAANDWMEAHGLPLRDYRLF